MHRLITRLLQLTLLAGVALLVWGVAPALSLRAYIPPAKDFEQRLPRMLPVDPDLPAAGGARGPHPGEGPVTSRSPVIDAPDRFDLVGIAREVRHYELRVRSNGGEWSEWVEAVDGTPVYTGGSDQVQVRARGWRPDGRLHYVNVSGTSGPLDEVVNDARRTVNDALRSVIAVLTPEADAHVREPRMITRREWGANRKKGGCEPRNDPAYGKVKAAVVHHTVSANEYTEAEAPSIVLGICRFHRNGNGWDDIGYNALVDRFGNIYAGRAGGMGKAVVGAQSGGFNSQTTGVAVIGTHTSTPFRPSAVKGTARFLAWKLSTHGLPAIGRTRLISGGGASRYPEGQRVRVKRITQHQRLNPTSCPGDGGRSKLRSIRRRAQRRIDDSTGASARAPQTGSVVPGGDESADQASGARRALHGAGCCCSSCLAAQAG